jgi:hypothetical protein
MFLIVLFYIQILISGRTYYMDNNNIGGVLLGLAVGIGFLLIEIIKCLHKIIKKGE